MNADIYKFDLENRFPTYTVEEISINSIVTVNLKDGSTIVASAKGMGRDSPMEKLREGQVGGREILPCLTTTERDSLTFKSGQEILNITDGNIIQYWDGTIWITSGSALEWLDLNRSSTLGDQTGIDSGVDIIMDNSRGNGIVYNSTAGIVTLKAGRIYRLWASFAMFSLVDNEIVVIQWVKSSDNLSLVTGHETRIRESESTSNGNSSNTIEVIYNPTVDTNIKLRCIEYTGTPDTVTMYWDRSMATVIELK